MADWLKNLQDNFPDIKTGKYFSDFTTLQIGGPIKAFIEVQNQSGLINLLKYVQKNHISHLVIGSGSNLLVSDSGFNGLVIKTGLTGIEKEDQSLIVQSGTLLNDLVDYTIQNGFDGMSTMKGIPGTVGGAIYGAAGAYGDNIRDFLQQVTYFDGENIKTFSRSEYETGYRDSIFKHHKSFTIISAKFGNFPLQNPHSLKAESQQILEKRKVKYPPDTKCPGSFFKNVVANKLSPEVLKKIPPEKILYGKIPAGYLLEAVGAKNDQLGQIKISQNHANTFINLGTGTAQDFYTLAQKYYLKVKEKFGINLEPEVQLINLPPFE